MLSWSKLKRKKIHTEGLLQDFQPIQSKDPSKQSFLHHVLPIIKSRPLLQIYGGKKTCRTSKKTFNKMELKRKVTIAK